MPTTPEYGWRTPAAADANDVPLNMATLAGQVEGTVKSHRDAATASTTQTVGTGTYVITHGKLRELIMNTTTGIPNGVTSMTGVSVPPGSRPSPNQARGRASLGGVNVGDIVVNTDGTVIVINVGPAGTAVNGRVMWLV